MSENEKLNETAEAADKDTPIIFLDDVKVTFKTRTGSILHPNKVQAVKGLTLKLMPGETIGIVGESGCGKSTTANVMCGLQKPTSGRVYFKWYGPAQPPPRRAAGGGPRGGGGGAKREIRPPTAPRPTAASSAASSRWCSRIRPRRSTRA